MSGEAGKVEYTFLWFVEKCAYLWHERGEPLKSPFFTADRLEGKSWFLHVYPRGDREKGFLALSLVRGVSDEEPETVSLDYELSLHAEDGSTLRSGIGKSSFRKGEGSGWQQFVETDKVPRGTLIVSARVWKGEGEVHEVVAPICARTRIAVEAVGLVHEEKHFRALEPNQKKESGVSPHPYIASSTLHFDDEGEMTFEITPADSHRHLCRLKIRHIGWPPIMIPCGQKDNRFPSDRREIRKLPLFVSRDEILNNESRFLLRDTLMLFYECFFSTGLEFERIEDTPLRIPKTALEQAGNQSCDQAAENVSTFPSVAEDLKALYLNERLTDVELRTKSKSFQAHRSVLCARSPVFGAMMTNDMRERNTGCINVDDLEEDVVRQLLLFLYSDEVGHLRWDSATRLYYAADKYQVRRLRGECSAFLLGHLTYRNAGELLVLADAHGDAELKKKVEEYILQNEEKVFGSEEWERLTETHPLLAVKTMHLKYKS